MFSGGRMAEDIAITFETLYDILRREKSREELQELNLTFFDDVVSYLKDKQKLSEGPEDSMFASDSMKTQQQIENIKRIIRDIYDIREKKIIGLARDVSRTGSNLINMKALLPEENKMYQQLLFLFDNFRRNVLHRVLTTELPNIGVLDEEQPKAIKRVVKSHSTGLKLVRFIESVQQFVGPDLEPIGPFKKDDMATLPDEVVRVLIAKNSIEEIEEKE
jgi:DNA replication initiation complex subunit (GINS family)